MVRIDRQDLIILRERGVRPALIPQNVAKIEAGHGQVLAHRQRALVTRDRVGQAALLAAHIAEIEMGERANMCVAPPHAPDGLPRDRCG